MQRLLIIGCGDVMRRALPWLTRRARVYATARDPEDFAALRRLGAVPILADLDCPASLKRLAGLAPWVIHSAPPPGDGTLDARTRRLVAALGSRGILPRRLCYISTTGVYGDCGGAWVSEDQSAKPQSGRGRRRLDAEAVLRRLGTRAPVAVSILRAPGIYAADRLPTARLLRGDPVLTPEEDVRTNHIHAGDLARIACLALYRGGPNRVYNACDDTDLAMGDWFDLVADVAGLPRPPRLSRKDAAGKLSSTPLSFMSESRRLTNRRLKVELRYRLRYATVEAGLAGIRSRLTLDTDTKCSGSKPFTSFSS